MSRLRRFLAKSDHPCALVCAPGLPRVLFVFHPGAKGHRQAFALVLCGGRSLWHAFLRVAIAEPLFKAYCTHYGRRVRTGIYVHWIQGHGEIVLGDDVFVDGKCSISFSARFSDRPFLHIGDHTTIAHNCSLTIGKGIRIGRHCLVASNVCMFDSAGHASDPEARQQGLPPADNHVRPITLEDNVWIGRHAIIFPGVTIGEGSIVSAGAVVMADVPPYTVVAGNPAKKILPGLRNPRAAALPATSSVSSPATSPATSPAKSVDHRSPAQPGAGLEAGTQSASGTGR